MGGNTDTFMLIFSADTPHFLVTDIFLVEGIIHFFIVALVLELILLLVLTKKLKYISKMYFQGMLNVLDVM